MNKQENSRGYMHAFSSISILAFCVVLSKARFQMGSKAILSLCLLALVMMIIAPEITARNLAAKKAVVKNGQTVAKNYYGGRDGSCEFGCCGPSPPPFIGAPASITDIIGGIGDHCDCCSYAGQRPTVDANKPVSKPQN